MRVGLIVYGLDRPLTGISRYTLELVRALAEQSPRPDIHLLAAGGIGPLEKATPFPVVPLFGCRYLPALLSLGNFIIANAARRLGLDVLHDPTGVSPFLGSLGNYRCVACIYDVIPWAYPGHSSLLDTMIYRWWLPRLAPKLDAILTASNHSRQDILHFLAPQAERISVIPIGVSARFSPQPDDQTKNSLKTYPKIAAPYILHVGTLTQRKNVLCAIEAFALIKDKFPDLHFVITGPRAWKHPPIEAMIAKHDLSERVIMTGPVPEEELVALYNGAAIFVFLSLYEGFGLPVAEAMACGTPVIASSATSLPEVAGEAAILVDPLDIQSIAGALGQILENPALAGDLRERGLLQAQKFTWSHAAKETISVYKRLMQADPGRR